MPKFANGDRVVVESTYNATVVHDDGDDTVTVLSDHDAQAPVGERRYSVVNRPDVVLA